MPVALWVYVFIATILLVNLLIAQMSDVYAKVQDQAVEYWTYSFLNDLVREYKDSRNLPAPFNILRAPKLLPWILRVARGHDKRKRGVSHHGFAWQGGHSEAEVIKTAKCHRMRQAALCEGYIHKEEQDKEKALESQVDQILAQQLAIDSKQDLRLEAIVSVVTHVKELVAASGSATAGPQSKLLLAKGPTPSSRLPSTTGPAPNTLWKAAYQVGTLLPKQIQLPPVTKRPSVNPPTVAPDITASPRELPRSTQAAQSQATSTKSVSGMSTDNNALASQTLQSSSKPLPPFPSAGCAAPATSTSTEPTQDPEAPGSRGEDKAATKLQAANRGRVARKETSSNKDSAQ